MSSPPMHMQRTVDRENKKEILSISSFLRVWIKIKRSVVFSTWGGRGTYRCCVDGCGDWWWYLLLVLTASAVVFGDGLFPLLALIFEKASRVSGKFGGVAGVLQGVMTCPKCAEAEGHGGTVASWKNMLRAVSNCQWADCSSCFACSLAQPAAKTNWLIMTCSLSAVSISYFSSIRRAQPFVFVLMLLVRGAITWTPPDDERKSTLFVSGHEWWM